MNLNVQIEKAIHLLKENFNPIAIYLFGSASRNELRKDSDIDIAFLTDYNIKIDPYTCFMNSQELADIFNRDIDLIHLNSSSTVFKAQVVSNGKLIYCSNNKKRMYFEMYALKDYAFLNEEREVILKNIRESGTIYGK